MFLVTGSHDAPGLDREQLWAGLVRKAEDPVPFVPAITRCRVLSRTEDGLVREILLRGARVRERVTFFPRDAVRFDRLSGPVLGTIWNRIEVAEDGACSLRFTFELDALWLSAGSAEERAYAAMMSASYLRAIETTIAETRRMTRRSAG